MPQQTMAHRPCMRSSPRTSVTMEGLHINTLRCNPFIVTEVRGEVLIQGLRVSLPV